MKRKTYYLQELTHVIDRISSLENIRIQTMVFFGTANLTAIGISLNEQQSGIMFIAVAFLAAFLIIDIRVRKQQQIYYYRGIQLQRKCSDNDKEAFLELHPGKQASKARELLKLESPDARICELSKSSAHLKGFFFWFPLLVMIGELIFAIVSYCCLDWILF